MFLFDILGGSTPPRLRFDAQFQFSNWIKIHAFIRSTPNTREGVRTLAKVLVAEYMRRPGPRMDVVTRVYGKLSRVRYEVERVELGAR